MDLDEFKTLADKIVAKTATVEEKLAFLKEMRASVANIRHFLQNKNLS